MNIIFFVADVIVLVKRGSEDVTMCIGFMSVV